MFIFVKDKLYDNISSVDINIVKTGMMGTAGNKGSCFIRFNYLDTNFSVVCAHLSAGGSHNKARLAELTDIIHKPLLDTKTKKVHKFIKF